MIVALSIELMEHYSNIAIKIIFNLQKVWPVLPVFLGYYTICFSQSVMRNLRAFRLTSTSCIIYYRSFLAS